MSDYKEKNEHESFAMLGFRRIQTDESSLYGSNLKHNTIIEMQLSHSTMRRDTNHISYYADKHIATVQMSQNQFSELITSLNIGDGIPVTLKYTETKGHISPPPFDSVVERHENEFKAQNEQSIKEAKELLASVKDLLKGSGTLKKADRESIIKATEKLERDIGTNTNYRIDCFKKAMDNTIIDAKSSIETFYQKRIVDAGLKALNEETQKNPVLLVK